MKSLRAWDDVARKMLYAKPEQFDDMLGYRFDGHFETDKPVYMWGTGLKDRNGKEIYEGDVVKVKIQGGYSDHYCDIEHTKTVTYNDESACWKPFDRCRMWREEGESKLKAVEVIGNIYDNPNLLEG